jgi:hypothetical protein
MSESTPIEPTDGAGPMPDDPPQTGVSQDPEPEFDPEVTDQ